MRPGLPHSGLIICADDFGLDRAVNEAVEEAHRHGILTTASLMVGAPAAVDAIARARRLPGLRVGLHLVLIDGRHVLPDREISGLLRDNQFDRNMVRAGFRFYFVPSVRRQLRREIRAQFEAFCATGLELDHVNGHKHMQVHPTVAEMIVEIGRDFGMTAVRVPYEPVEVLRRAFPGEGHSTSPYQPWIKALHRRLRGAGLFVNDNLFGLAWSGRMVEERLLGLVGHLPEGINEIYLHPAAERTPALVAAMPGYRHDAEFSALLSRSLKSRLAELRIRLGGYRDFCSDR